MVFFFNITYICSYFCSYFILIFQQYNSIDTNYPDDGTWGGEAFRRGVQTGADEVVLSYEKQCLEDTPDECIAIGENAAQGK